MGVKIAVVGGASTYTPELVEGFVTRERPPARRRAGAARHRRRAPRDRRRPRAADARPPGVRRDADAHLRPDGGDRRRRRTSSCSCASAARPPVCATRRIPLRFGCIGQETTGPGRVRQGPAHGARRARHRRGDGRARRARRVGGRLHEPGRHRHAGAAGRGPPRDRPVQRGDRVPADPRRRASASSPSACSSSTSA